MLIIPPAFFKCAHLLYYIFSFFSTFLLLPVPPKYRLPGLYYFLLFVIYTINLLLSILRVCFPLFILYILAMLGDIFVLKAESSMLLPFVLVCSLLPFYKLIHYFLQWIVFKVNDFFLITPAAPSDTNQSMI